MIDEPAQKEWAHKKQKTVLYIVSLCCAALVAFISLLVIAIWHLKSPFFLEGYDWIFYMKHLTALLFLASSSGLFLIAYGNWKGALAAGGFVTLVSILILLQYISGLDLHIDQLLLKDYAYPDTAHPGRPAPNTAAAFLCIGISLTILVLNQKSQNKAGIAFVELIGFFIFVLGAYAISGYIQSVEQAYAWGTDTRMSIHTAISHMAMGIGLLSISWYHQKRKVAEVPLWLPAVICFLALQADLAASPGIIISIVYIPLIFCSLWFTSAYTVFILALIATFLSVLRYFMLPIEYMTGEVLANRLLTLGGIWFVALLIYWKRLIDLKLQHSEKYLMAILNHTVEGLIVIDNKGIVKNFNPASEKIFGYTADEVIGENVKMLMPSPYHEEHDQYLKNYRETGKKKIIGIGREVEGRKKDGTVFPIDLAVSEMEVEGKQFFSGIVRDITDRKKSEEELLRSNTELERFAFVAAHDLQEPLRIILKSTEFLKEDYENSLSEGAVKYINNTRTAAKRMRALVRDLLDYSRIGYEESRYQMVSMHECLKIALDNLEQDIEDQEAEIVIDGHFPNVKGNPVQLVRLYQNLIGNAIKYRNKDKNPYIHISVKATGNEWVFSVEDNGIGIDQNYLKQIFVPFKRLHTAKEYPGTGIGLAMCKKIAEAHHGRIWVQSELGAGSTFYFTLPMSLASEK